MTNNQESGTSNEHLGTRDSGVGLHWSPTGTRELVLIVDDEPHIVLSLEFLLQRAGYETAAAADGEEGLSLVRRLRPSVVLLDVMLPKRNGYEICQTIKSDPDTRATPVIMLSAKGQEVEIHKGLALGAAAYVTKPFGNAEILEAIRAALEPRP